MSENRTSRSDITERPGPNRRFGRGTARNVFTAIELLPECRELPQLASPDACFDGRDGAFGVALTAFANNENTQHRVVSVAVETFRMLRRWCEKG